MRLGWALLKLHGGRGRRAQGNIWIGKHRIAHNVYPHTLERMTESLMIEERNLFLLRNPYMTVDQERGAMREANKGEEWVKKWRVVRAAHRVKPSVTMEQKFKEHLCRTEEWDV